MAPTLRSRSATAVSMEYEDALGLIDHRNWGCAAILDELQAETRDSHSALTTNIWFEHPVPLIVSAASPEPLRPVPMRVVDDEEEAGNVLSLALDNNAATVSSTVASISEQEMDALRAEGARNPFGDQEDECFSVTISVDTENFLRINSRSLFIKPVALRATDLFAL